MDALLGRARDSRTGFVDLVRSKKATLGSSIKFTQSSSSPRLIIFQRPACDSHETPPDTLRALSDGGDGDVSNSDPQA